MLNADEKGYNIVAYILNNIKPLYIIKTIKELIQVYKINK